MKLLFAGDVDGRLEELFARVTSVSTSKAGPFDCLFCVGRFFSRTSKTGAEGDASLAYITGHTPVPIPTYFIVAQDTEVELPDEGGEVANNLHFLGKGGVGEIQGLRVAWVSGMMDKFTVEAGVSSIGAYTKVSVQRIIEDSTRGGKMVDLLLTSEWPRHVFSTSDRPGSFKGGSALIANLAKGVAPRFHFAATEGLFYQRVPYVNQPHQPVSRFLALSVLNPGMQDNKANRWLYAMNLVPAEKMKREDVMKQPPNCSANPYTDESIDAARKMLTEDEKRRKLAAGEPPEKQQKTEEEKETTTTNACWFCIENVKEDARHLVVSHGEYTYLALPKGALTPRHALIIPMQHYTCTPALHEMIQEEISKYVKSLTRFYSDYGEYPVMYERNLHNPKRDPDHLNLQIVPIPHSTPFSVVKGAFSSAALASQIRLDPYKPEDKLKGQFLLVSFPDGNNLVHLRKNTSKFFDLKFPRVALAAALGKQEKADWRQCALPYAEEVQLAAKFKEEFAQFDWTKNPQPSSSSSSSGEDKNGERTTRR